MSFLNSILGNPMLGGKAKVNWHPHKDTYEIMCPPEDDAKPGDKIETIQVTASEIAELGLSENSVRNIRTKKGFEEFKRLLAAVKEAHEFEQRRMYGPIMDEASDTPSWDEMAPLQKRVALQEQTDLVNRERTSALQRIVDSHRVAALHAQHKMMNSIPRTVHDAMMDALNMSVTTGMSVMRPEWESAIKAMPDKPKDLRPSKNIESLKKMLRPLNQRILWIGLTPQQAQGAAERFNDTSSVTFLGIGHEPKTEERYTVIVLDGLPNNGVTEHWVQHVRRWLADGGAIVKRSVRIEHNGDVTEDFDPV